MKSGQNTAAVFNLIRGSFVDGWGIRTTIFLKGCPLSCRWCCNPEGQSTEPELAITPEDCTYCGLCADICPHLLLPDDVGPVVDRDLCGNCGSCARICPTNALTMFGELYTVDRAFEVLIRDKAYYDRSGGGVTIGGGEATFSSEFTFDLMKRLQAEGIHVAIDTCGYMTSPLSLKILEQADLILFDIKGMDNERHIADTGVDNDGIIETLMHLGRLGKDIIIRLPLIPGRNDDMATLVKEAALISSVGSVRRIDLMPYHEFGVVKYPRLGLVYPLDGESPMPRERAEEIAEIFRKTGIPTQIGG